MKYRLMDILACPICKHYPPQLIVFQETTYQYPRKEERKPLCQDLCGLLQKPLKELDLAIIDCAKCIEREVVEGLLICSSCLRWYPIIEEIPHMLPDDLREAKEDIPFLEKYKERIPEKVLMDGKPFNLAKKA